MGRAKPPMYAYCYGSRHYVGTLTSPEARFLFSCGAANVSLFFYRFVGASQLRVFEPPFLMCQFRKWWRDLYTDTSRSILIPMHTDAALSPRRRPTTPLQDAVGNSEPNTGPPDGVDSQPGQEGSTNKCYLCHTPVDNARRMCNECYDAGKPFPDGQCSVCHVRFERSEASKKVTLPERYFAGFSAYLRGERGDQTRAGAIRARTFEFRDLLRCPIRRTDPLCRQRECVFYQRSRAIERGDHVKQKHGTPTYERPGRPTIVDETKAGAECHMCSNKLDESAAKRRAGNNFESWEHFFRILKQPVKALGTFTPGTRACNPCYMDWYNNRVRKEQPSVLRCFEGAKSYNEAADGEQRRLAALEKEIESCADAKTCVFYLTEKIKLLFRRQVLRCFLGANEPTTSTDLREILRGIIKEVDPGDSRLMILKSEEGADRRGEVENRRKLDRWVKKQLGILEETVPVGQTPETVSDGRLRPLYVFPYICNISQMGSLIDNLHRAGEKLKGRIVSLESDLAKAPELARKNQPDSIDQARSFARLLRSSVFLYARESDDNVKAQSKGTAALGVVPPVVEWGKHVPELLKAFLDELCFARPRKPGISDEEYERAETSRKCLVAGVLTSFACNTWYKNANVLAIVLKEQGIGRNGLDFLADALKICQTDNYQWRLWTRLADKLGSEAEMRRLIPLCACLIACSFDNVNLDILKHFGGGGHVDLVAAIGYYHALESRRRVAELPQQPLRLDFVRDFGVDAPRMTATWERFQRQILTCMQEEFVREDGDVEVRLAKMVIRDAPPEHMVGVQGRRVPDDVVARYLGVVETGTKRLEDIITYLDGLKQVLHVGEEGGRLRVVLVGDQETFTHAHKAKIIIYDWVLPWIGDWHLLEHTLDVIFRKWGGFGLFPLTKAADGYSKKLEKKDYHKRHFVFVGILEALWKACVGEVESREGRTMEPEELLGRLMQHRGSTDHKTFGQWVQLLLNDGMAYLAVYTSIRVGDFELREAAIRRIAPLFLGYNKNLYHALCIRHLADIAKLLPSERKFMSEIFSLSLSGNPGKNMGLDEIQETTMNKQVKQHAYGTRPRYLQRKAQTLQMMANAALAWKESFGSTVVYERKLYASQHRTLFVAKVYAALTANGSPFRLDDEKGRVSVISADGRVALPQLEATMLEASATSTTMFKTLTLQD